MYSLVEFKHLPKIEPPYSKDKKNRCLFHVFFWTDGTPISFGFSPRWISQALSGSTRFPQDVKEMAIKAFAVGAGQVNQTLQAGLVKHGAGPGACCRAETRNTNPPMVHACFLTLMLSIFTQILGEAIWWVLFFFQVVAQKTRLSHGCGLIQCCPLFMFSDLKTADRRNS